jgi:hypothetical protein
LLATATRPAAFALAALVLSCALLPAPARAATPERNFYDVLEDVMGDFEYDLKNGNVTGLKDLSIRNIATSENVPDSFRSHLELLITERILKTTKARVIQCLPCRAKRTMLTGDNVVITSPESNPVELARIAKMAGIANFLDVAFAYQPSGMILSMYISEPETGSIVWTRSYNSETSRAAAFRRGVDYSQIDDARKMTEYTPMIQYRVSVYYLFEPNFAGQTGTLGLGFRMVERYDNRKKEVGFEAYYVKDSSTIVGSNTTSTTTSNLYSGIDLTLLFLHVWNLIGEEENFNKPRGSVYAGIGGTYASGYLGGLVRGGYEWRLGKHYAVSANVGYRPSSTAFVGTTGTSISGVEFGVGIGMMF